PCSPSSRCPRCGRCCGRRPRPPTPPRTRSMTADAPLTARRRLGHLFRTSRPLSWINTAYPFGAAWLLAGGDLGPTFWVGCFFFLIPYNLAMYGINDVFDYESDLRNPRKGGVEGDVLDRRVHRTVIVAAIASCVPFVAWLAIVGHPAVLPVL